MSEIVMDIASQAARLQRSTLQSKNIRIQDRRTSVRLEPEMWEALHEIAAMEGCSIHHICTAVHESKMQATSFTAALRVFLMVYYRTAALGGRAVSLVQRRLKSAGGTGRAVAVAESNGHDHAGAGRQASSF